MEKKKDSNFIQISKEAKNLFRFGLNKYFLLALRVLKELQ